MASNDILDVVKADDNAVTALIDTMRAMAGNNAAMTKLLDRTGQALPVRSAARGATETITFTVPAMSLTEWCNDLRRQRITPVINVHFREVDEKLYRNINLDSFTVNDAEEGWRARDALANWPLVNENNLPIRNAEGNPLQWPTEEELKAAYDTAARAARVVNEAARAAQQQWKLLQKDHTNDTRAEYSLIRYLSDPKTIDWLRTIENIAEYGRESGYTLAHYKRALGRFVSHFDPSLRPITEKMEANEMATFLSNLTLPDYEFKVFEQQIHKLVRLPGQKIKAVMSTLHALAQSLYKGLEPTEAKALTNRVMVISLCSMTIVETKHQLEETIRTCYREKRKLKWELLLEGVMPSESKHGTPAMPLPFKKLSEPTLMNFNVVTTPYQGVASVKPLVNTGLDLSWEPESTHNSLMDPLTNPVISRLLYT
jgi:hypothetical protein